MEKGVAKNEDGAQRIKRNKIDQLGPKTLRAQGDVVVTESEYCPSHPLINHVGSNKDVPSCAVEQVRDDALES